MLIVQRPQIEEIQVSESRSRFVVEPLEPGFGYTLGNTLRRTLLSRIPGAAITTVRIEGVQHEFSTVDGVVEDVVDLLLNLKQVVLRIEASEPQQTLYLSAKGKGEVTASAIKCPAGVEVVNGDLHLATMSASGRLEIEMTAERGVGYRSADRNAHSEIIGIIPIDSIFSPVKRVAYSVEPARVGQRTDFDKLTMEVETNGAVDPQTAVSAAAAILRDDLVAIFLGESEESWPEAPVAPAAAQGRQPEDDMLIDDLDLGVRSLNCLKREGIETVGDLLARSEQELMCIPNFGRKSLDEVRERLDENKLKLRGE